MEGSLALQRLRYHQVVQRGRVREARGVEDSMAKGANNFVIRAYYMMSLAPIIDHEHLCYMIIFVVSNCFTRVSKYYPKKVKRNSRKGIMSQLLAKLPNPKWMLLESLSSIKFLSLLGLGSTNRWRWVILKIIAHPASPYLSFGTCGYTPPHHM